MTFEQAVELIRETSEKLQRSRKLPIEGDLRVSVMRACDTILQAGQVSEEPATDLLRVCVSLDPNMREKALRGVAELLSRRVIDAPLLTVAENPASRKWLGAIARELVRGSRLDEAETVYRAVADNNQARAIHIKDEFDFLLKHRGPQAGIKALLEGRAENFPATEVSHLASELGSDLDALAGHVDRLSDRMAMLLLLELRTGSQARSLDALVVLWRARGAGRFLIAMLIAFRRMMPDLANREEAIFRGDLILPGLGRWVARFYSPEAGIVQRIGSAREGEADLLPSRLDGPEGHRRDLQRALRWMKERHRVLNGAIPIEQFCGEIPPVGRIDQDLDVLVTFGPLSATAHRHYQTQDAPLPQLRRGNPSPEEREGASLILSSRFEPTSNSARGREIVAQARSASREFAREICEEPASELETLLRDEVLALALEDRLYGALRKTIGIESAIEFHGWKKVGIVTRKLYLPTALELARSLASDLSVKVFILLDHANEQDIDDVHRLWSEVQPSTDALLASILIPTGDHIEPRRVSLSLPEMRPTGSGGVMLVSSFSDASYLKTAVALTKGIERAGQPLTVFNGALTGSDAYRRSVGGRSRCLGVDENDTKSAQSEAGAAICDFLDRLAGRRLGLSPTARKTIVAFATAGRAGIASELAALTTLSREMGERRPAVVLTLPGRMVSARTATILARSVGVETIDLQAIYISSHPRYYPSLADVYAALTDDQLQIYALKQPIVEQDLIVAGSLMICEEIAASLPIERSQARSLAGVPSDAPFALYAAQYAQGSEGDAALEAIVRASQHIPNGILWVKVHPKTRSDDVRHMERLVSAIDIAGRVRVVKDGNIYQMMRGADLVLTQYSNVGLEAAVLGLPVLSVNLTGEDYVVDPYRVGIAERASSLDEVVEKMSDLLQSPVARLRLAAQQDAYFKANPMLRRVDVARCISEFVISRGERDPAKRLSFDEIVRRVDANPLPLVTAEQIALEVSGTPLKRGWAMLNERFAERFWAGRGVAVRGARHFWHMLPSQIRVRLVPTAERARTYFGRRRER